MEKVGHFGTPCIIIELGWGTDASESTIYQLIEWFHIKVDENSMII